MGDQAPHSPAALTSRRLAYDRMTTANHIACGGWFPTPGWESRQNVTQQSDYEMLEIKSEIVRTGSPYDMNVHI